MDQYPAMHFQWLTPEYSNVTLEEEVCFEDPLCRPRRTSVTSYANFFRKFLDWVIDEELGRGDLIIVQTGVHDLIGGIDAFVEHTRLWMDAAKSAGLECTIVVRPTDAIHSVATHTGVLEAGMRFPFVKQFRDVLMAEAKLRGFPVLDCWKMTASRYAKALVRVADRRAVPNAELGWIPLHDVRRWPLPLLR